MTTGGARQGASRVPQKIVVRATTHLLSHLPRKSEYLPEASMGPLGKRGWKQLK